MRSIDLFRSSKSKPSVQETGQTPQKEQKVILAVIGSSQIQSAIEQSLESIFVELVFVGSGEAAIEYLNKKFVSLLISEINLPMMNGLNLSRKIKEDETLRDIPVLLISDSGEGPDKVMGTETGADDYVTLPINPSDLRSRVMALISRRDAKQSETNTVAVKNEIFEDGILSSEEGAGVSTIPEDEIGLGDPVEENVEDSDPTIKSVEEKIEEPSRVFEEEKIKPSESESTSTEEILNPASPLETPSTNPLRSEVGQPSEDIEDSSQMKPQDDYLAQDPFDRSTSDKSVQINETDQNEAEPDPISNDNSEMLDDIFGGASATEATPSAEDNESQPEHNEPPSTLTDSGDSAPTMEQPTSPIEEPIQQPPITPAPIPPTPSPVATTPIEEPVQQPTVTPASDPLPNSAAQTPETAVQIEQPVQQPTVTPAPAPINSQEATVVPVDNALANTSVETPAEPPVTTEGSIPGVRTISSGGSEQFNEYEIGSMVDHKEIYQSAISHLIKLESDIIEGTAAEYSDIIRDANKIVASVRQSNYLQIRAMGKRDGSDFPIHSINVTVYSVKLATGLKYDTKKLIELAIAALLHDVGMLLIPKDIRHAQRKLSPEEISILKTHPQQGSDFLNKAVQSNPELAAYTFLPIVVLQEHERFNGTGYPSSIPGDELHEYAKIISIIDMYEAVSHPSNYRDEYLAYEALQKVVALKDSHFDVKLLRALVREISIFPIDSVVRLNDGQIGKVIGLEPSHPMRPKLLLLYDAEGNKHEEEKELALSKSPFLYVEVPISEEDVEKLGN